MTPLAIQTPLSLSASARRTDERRSRWLNAVSGKGLRYGHLPRPEQILTIVRTTKCNFDTPEQSHLSLLPARKEATTPDGRQNGQTGCKSRPRQHDDRHHHHQHAAGRLAYYHASDSGITASDHSEFRARVKTVYATCCRDIFEQSD